MRVTTYSSFQELDIQFIGPPLSEGPLPTVIYFSLCATESLGLDPFNQPALVLARAGCRVFSITLPGHGPHFDKFKAMEYWANHLDELYEFIQKSKEFIDHILLQPWVIAESIASMGLSRGGFIATHLAAHPNISAVMGFAPVTALKALDEIKDHPIAEKLSLDSLFHFLKDKKIRYYIGNRDIRVGTDAAFNFVFKLADFSYNERVRSPTVELFITPSTGQYGHGTLPHIFEEGALWLKKQIVK